MSRQYSVLEHGMMLADRRRTSAYLAALRHAVRAGDIVVDVGSGTGIFAVEACRAGARRVHAIEPGLIARVARQVVVGNGCADRVEILEQLSSDVTLGERADVVILDVRGVLPDDQIWIAHDARARLLREGGRIIPESDTLWAAPVDADALYDQHVRAWDADVDGLDLAPLREKAVRRWYKCRTQPEQLVAAAARLGTILYAQAGTGEFHGTAEWTLASSRAVHGVVVWFESQLDAERQLSNRPGEPELLYGQGFFPLEQPRVLAAGARVQFALRAARTDSGHEWKWQVKV
jgi:protein arginine N-methyltransferase 1